ncbi:RNA polymerase II C-terminal domain phosphatase-like 4 [Silene latifolia]|uniref:RNA polymerase II C-terminal domain phosphatase-like 4 n=1 Tax=Silene latifolia TaxID=37657 RepID=UPI003D784B5E
MSTSLAEGLKAYRDRDLESLLERKKLHLVLDLDHTLIHSREKTKLTLGDKQLILNPNLTLPEILNGTYLVKLRPGVDVFLRKVSTMFDLSIFTMGSENYAKLIKNLLEDFDNGVQFREVLSREDCQVSKKKTLDMFLSHERVVVIVDDTDHVWMNSSHNEANLVKIAPYNFFTSRGVSNPCSKLEGVDVQFLYQSMDEELARVLAILRSVHDGFYGGLDCVDRDVRQVLKLVRECEEHKRGGREGGEEVNARKGKRSYEASFDQPMDSSAAAKRYKACNNVIDLRLRHMLRILMP